MPDFNDILHTLKTAIKGEDMRQAIYDGMKMLYENGEPGHVEDDWARAQIAEIIRTRGNLLNLTEVPFTLKDVNDQELSELYINGQTFTIDKTEFPLDEYKYILIYFKTVSTATPEVRVYNREEFLDTDSVSVIASTFIAHGTRTDIQEIHIKVLDAALQNFEVNYARAGQFRIVGENGVTGVANTNYVHTTVDAGNSTDRLAGSIVKISGIKFYTDVDYTDIQNDITELQNQIDTFQAMVDTGNIGMTTAIKNALMAIIDVIPFNLDDQSDAETLRQNLYDALYPSADVLRISAIFVPRGGAIIYDTDSLDSIKQYLTVTAYLTNGQAIQVREYTLSGSLQEGTSTIIVTYSGYSASVDVTNVLHRNPLHPFINGSHVFTSVSRRTLEITNGNHVAFTDADPNGTLNRRGSFLNIGEIIKNNSNGTRNENVVLTDPMYTIPAGSEVTLSVSNIQWNHLTDHESNFVFALRNEDINVFRSGDRYDNSKFTVKTTLQLSTPITCFMLYLYPNTVSFSADVYLYVDGVRWV